MVSKAVNMYYNIILIILGVLLLWFVLRSAALHNLMEFDIEIRTQILEQLQGSQDGE